MAEERDEQLADRSARGDRTAFEELVRRHRGAVYRLCWSVTGNHADADDAAQDAFVRVFRGLHSYDTARPFLPWLRRIAHNAALDVISRRFPAVCLSPEDPTPDPPDPAPGPEQRAMQREGRELALPLVAALPSEMRTAFLLRAVEGMSYREIADATGAPLGTVMSRLARAREKILSALKKEGAS